VECGLQSSQSVILEHVQKGSLSGIVQTKEEDFSVLVQQPELREDIPKPVDNEHGGRRG